MKRRVTDAHAATAYSAERRIAGTRAILAPQPQVPVRLSEQIQMWIWTSNIDMATYMSKVQLEKYFKPHFDLQNQLVFS